MNHNQTATEVHAVIGRVTALLPCGPCGRAGFDPRIPAAAAPSFRTTGA